MENEKNFKDICEDLNKNFKIIRNCILARIFAIFVHVIIGIYVVYMALTNNIELIWDILASAICVYVIMIMFYCYKDAIKNFKIYRLYKSLIKISKTIEEAENENSK